MLLENKVALITGAGRGIGAAIAKSYAENGAIVIVNYLHRSDCANKLVASITSFGGRAIAVPCDVRDEVAVKQMVTSIVDNYGTIDVVVNNALSHYEFDPKHRKMLGNLIWQDYQSQIDGSVKSIVNVMQAVLPYLKLNQGSHVINLTSDLVDTPTIPYHDYIVGKSAVIGLNRTMASELGAYGVYVNAIAPGLTYPTDSSKYTKRDVREDLIAKTPTRRLTTPKDVSGTAVFLASELSSNITGQCIFVDGGLHMG
ncbi:MAG: SDR family oxidoreductase [Lentilactobacillus hilgardii]|uniref:SDR family oxidoreductase n=1 Tax=Lactobacillaceae TaxID=33958 RepID=UPI0039E98430